MKILFITQADERHASSRVRVFQYLPHLEREGVRCRVVHLWPTHVLGIPRYIPVRARASAMYPMRMLEALWQAGRHDVTFVNLALFPISFQNALRARGRRLVFDFVDPIYISSQAPDRAAARLRDRFDHMLRIASGVVSGNDLGAELARSRSSLVANIVGPVDTDRYRASDHRSTRNEVVIGWIGTSSTSRYLKLVAEPLRRVLQLHPNARLELIGAANPPLGDLPHTNHRWSLADEVALLQRFDIGIMPLPDDPWTRGKGGYKLLQYMSTATPSIASPVGINRQIIRNGINGFLADSPDEWVGRLSDLIEDAGLRRRMGEHGRSDAEASYSLARSVPRLIDLFARVQAEGASAAYRPVAP